MDMKKENSCMRDIEFYKFEERNNCPYCTGHLHFEGTLNSTDCFVCRECDRKFKVNKNYKQKEDGRISFLGYSNFREVNN